MKQKEIFNLGIALGLKGDIKENLSNRGYIVFNGANNQRFLIYTNLTKKQIYKKLGEFLILMGKRMKAMEISRAISITDD